MKNLYFLLASLLLWTTSCNSPNAEKRVHKLLIDRQQTLSTAESCTGGTIAARFVAMPGASAYFKCGVVVYGLDTKRDLLHISGDTVARYGAVSEEIARQMADGVRATGSSHYAVATTGVAGPTGGTPENPVGTVWIAVSSPTRTVTRKVHIKGNRKQVIRKAGTEAIEMLEAEMLADK